MSHGPADELVRVIQNSEDDTYLAVAPFPGPDRWYIRMYPQRVIRQQAQESTVVIMVEGLLLLIVIIAILALVVQRRVGVS